MQEDSVKRKLTLSVDEKVVEKAKTLGMNISDITERVLKTFAFAPELEKASVYEKYEELMKVMSNLLKEYDTKVAIGEWVESPESLGKDNIMNYYFNQYGVYETDIEELAYDNIRRIPLYDLYEPKKILDNFIIAIAEAKEKNKEKIADIELVKRVILSFTEDFKKPSTNQVGA